MAEPHRPVAVLSSETFASRFDRGDLQYADAPTFRVEYPDLSDVRADPTSEEYASRVMATWRAITGRERYEAEVDETFALDHDLHLARPFPFVSGDPTTVGAYVGAIAWFLREVAPRPGDRVVEFGTGWGHLAMMLARLGCSTTAVDLNPPSVALLREQAILQGVPLDVVECSFTSFEATDLDLVVFFEAFHHCERPFELLDRCGRMLRDGGRLVLLADAVYDGFYAPWGVRLDGDAAFMARQTGWLELGFDRAFMYRELRARGFSITDHSAPELGSYGSMVVATKCTAHAGLDTVLPSDEEVTWDPRRPVGLPGRFAGWRSLVTVDSDPERSVADVSLVNLGDSTVEVLVGAGTETIALVLDAGGRELSSLTLPKGRRVLEVSSSRARCGALGFDEVGVLVESIMIR